MNANSSFLGTFALQRVLLIALSALSPVVLAQHSVAQSGPQSQVASAEAARPIEEVLVTARRRTESLQKVPMAVSVVGASELERSYVVNTQFLSILVPTLNYNSANPRNTAFTIRGLGSSVVAVAQSNDGLESGVGFYIDQVYAARPAVAAFDFSDIERVEVLRGPQGTLFGKNTTAGAIHVISQAPEFKTRLSGEVSVGNDHTYQAKASANAVLVDDKVAVRLAGYRHRRDGVVDNVLTGQKLNNISTDALRGQLLFRLSDTLSYRVIGDWSNFDAACCVQVFYKIGQTQRPVARQYAALASGINYGPPSFDPYDRLTDIDVPVLADTSQGGVTGIGEWSLGAVILTSVSAWRFWKWTAANDRDYTSVRVQLVQRIPSRQDQYSQEFRLATQNDGAFNAIGGLYFFQQKLRGKPETVYGPGATYWLIGIGPNAPASLLNGYTLSGDTTFRSTSYAAFGEGTYNITDALTFAAGLRYTAERKTGDYATRVSGGLANPTPAQLANQLSILRPQSYQAKDSDGSGSGRANLAYEFSDQQMVYLSAARGFKSGGINMAGLPLDPQNQPALPTAVIKPERNITYELGVKSQFHQRLVINTALYRTTVTNFQANIVDTGPGALRGYLANIPKVRVKGIEADATWALAEGIALRGGSAYTDSVYAAYRNGPCPLDRIAGGTQVCDLTGRPLPNTPKWSVNVGVAVERPASLLGLQGAIMFDVDATSRTRVSGDGPASVDAFIPGYSVVNASLGYKFHDRWQVRLFARNVFATDYMQNVTIQAGNSGLILGTPNDPRLVGITLRFSM